MLPTVSWPRPAAAWSRPESLVDELVVPVDDELDPLSQPCTFWISVWSRWSTFCRSAIFLSAFLQYASVLVAVHAWSFCDPRLHVRVELLEPRLDLLGERDALLRSAARAAAAVLREAQLDAVDPVAQVLEPLPGAALALRRRRRGRRRAGAGRGVAPVVAERDRHGREREDDEREWNELPDHRESPSSGGGRAHHRSVP